MKRILSSASILIFTLAMSANAQSAPACVGHFYNKSNFQWSLFNFDGKKTFLKIEPNTSVDISWSVGQVTLNANIPNRPFFKQITLQAAGSCPAFSEPGNFGPVMLANPTDLDITTCTGNC